MDAEGEPAKSTGLTEYALGLVPPLEGEINTLVSEEATVDLARNVVTDGLQSPAETLSAWAYKSSSRHRIPRQGELPGKQTCRLLQSSAYDAESVRP